MPSTRLNRSRGRALRRAAWPWWTMGACCLTMKGQEASPEPMIVQHDDRAISRRQRWERTERNVTTSASRIVFEYPNRCGWRCSHDIRRTRNNSVGRYHVEIFVRPMWHKGCPQADNAKVAICALFTTPNSLKLQERRKAFSPIRKVRAISQKLYSDSPPPNPLSV